MVPSAASLVRDVFEGVEQTEIVLLVDGKIATSSEVHVLCVSSGAHSRRSIESVDLKAGVVGDDEQAGRETGVVGGLHAGVAGEGGFVLGWGRHLGQSRERLDGQGLVRVGGGEVAQLALVRRGDVDGHDSIEAGAVRARYAGERRRRLPRGDRRRWSCRASGVVYVVNCAPGATVKWLAMRRSRS